MGDAIFIGASALFLSFSPGKNLGRLHAIGDSLTFGAGGSSGTGGYRRKLDSKLALSGYQFEWVGSVPTWPGGSWPAGKHDGHGGWTTWDLVHGRNHEGSIDDWLEEYQSDTILLMVGRNDPWDWSYSYAWYRSLINEIYEERPQATVYWSNVLLPQDHGPASHYQCDMQDFAIRQNIAEQKALGRRVWYIDGYRKLANRTDIYSDSVHLNDVGYRLLADVFFTAIKKTPVAMR